MCGTEPFPTDFKAKKYKLEKHFFMKVKNLVIGSWHVLLWVSKTYIYNPTFQPKSDIIAVIADVDLCVQ